MKVLQPIATVCLLALGCACTTSAPKSDVGFERAQSIQALEGCFKSHGEGGKDTAQRLLSKVTWPTANLNHANVKAVRVVAMNSTTLKVTAETDEETLHESLFVEGRDFFLESGRIRVRNDLKVSPTSRGSGGNVFIGVLHESTELGIDRIGDGRLQEATSLAGTAFLVFPAAGRVRHVSRFRNERALCK